MPAFAWCPNPGRQELFHSSSVFELLYGGAAGGGKSESLLVEALRYVHVPTYTGILFRRTFPELRQPRGLIERSRAIYPLLGGRYVEQTHQWRFPSGALITFDHLEHEDDRLRYQSAELAYIGFDELTSFLETQYKYLFSRARTTAVDPKTGTVLPVRVRSATNPGNIGHQWVKERFIQQGPLAVKWYQYDDDGNQVEVPPDTPLSLSRQFIPAKLSDNPVLTLRDPMYATRLRMLSLIERAQLIEGNWDILAAGNVFRKEWFQTISPAFVPPALKWRRYWDLAASQKKRADNTSSAATAFDQDGNFYIRDMITFKKEWPDAYRIILNTAEQEANYVKDIGIEKAQHGIAATQSLIRDPRVITLGAKHHVKFKGIDVKGDKLERAGPWLVRAEQGHTFLVEGSWIPAFLEEGVVFDGSGRTHDDRIDGVSGSHGMHVTQQWMQIPFLHL